MQLSSNFSKAVKSAKLIRVNYVFMTDCIQSPRHLSSLHLKSTKKFTTNNSNELTRIKSAEDTLAEIIPVCEKIGVTRISDITYMDKLYIPNYSAILPGTEDSIWVYSGKGDNKSSSQSKCFDGSHREIFFLI